ncbi:hypothetical protein Q8W71_13025 [Methylobacterium sp. NEAU 140]|uniref:hypothetical protein n=1 Tax=Methylobacterium sp. NEAU 140 TaxID=3064945 RepID=UPI0027364148|nr:hypothetical protein [Methylobacterium sp. NEAU 140]MDP4023554.1 hypothetical protein [Methylobacterium sp. NEAU 140]
MIGRRSRYGILCGALLACLAGPVRAEEGNIFSNLLKYGGTTVPPSQPKELEAAYCPSIDVAEGGAALRTMAGGNVRTQISLGRLARECARRADGSITVRVGVDARVLLGPAGAPGRFEVPVTIQIKHNDKVIVTRTERASAEIAPGEAQGFATLVSEDIGVPAAMSADYEIEVSLGAKGKTAPAKARRKKPAVAAAPPGGGDAAQ